MTSAQITWTVLIAAQAVVNLPFILALLKGTPMSDAFKAALAALVQHYTDKITALQAEVDAAVADKAAALDALDAEATAEVTAATPQ